MSITILFVLLFLVLVYWIMTQILPERQRVSLLRPGLADGLLEQVNERRHQKGLPLLELDEGLLKAAESKAVHQLTTGVEEEGWEYPDEYQHLLGRSLLMEALLTGPMTVIGERLNRQRDLFDGEWIRCGIGVAGGQENEIVVALILCREAWEPVPEMAARRSLLLGK